MSQPPLSPPENPASLAQGRSLSGHFVAKGPCLRAKTGVTLLGGGDVSAQDLAQSLALAPVLMAADGGADAALGLGHMPDAVVGDFDSLSPLARASIPLDRQFPVEEQELTDFGKCLSRLQAPFVLGLGLTGPRLDHFLAVLSQLAHAPMPCLVLGPDEVIFRCPAQLDLALAPGLRVSLWPLAPVRAWSAGLQWPLSGLDLRPEGRIGTSNRALGPVSLRAEGPLLVLLPREALGAVLAGLGLAGLLPAGR